MSNDERVLLKISELINSLQAEISRQPWGRVSKIVFTNTLEKSVSGLDELKDVFSKKVEELEKDPKKDKPDLRPFVQELEETLDILGKNLSFEKDKTGRAKTVNELEENETPELYADLEQKVLGILLKARYSLERLSIFLRRQGVTPLTENSTANQVMQILGRKEDELQDLRGKYEDIRKRSYMGYLEEETVADLEHELGDLGRRMALTGDELSRSIAFHKSQIEYIENSYNELKQKLESLEEIFTAYTEKSEDLIKNLKKERDYSKRIVLDVEHETLQLRNTYTSELLGMQQGKIAAKKEAEIKFLGEIKNLRKQLAEQTDLERHFRKLAEEKMKKEHGLEENVKKLTLLLKTKEKHEKVKKQLKGKERKAKKK